MRGPTGDEPPVSWKSIAALEPEAPLRGGEDVGVDLEGALVDSAVLGGDVERGDDADG